MESKHVLSDNIASVRNSLFYNSTTVIRCYDSTQTIKIILIFYKNNFQNKKIKTSNTYHTLDLAVLWFVNITKCYRRLALVCFMNNSFFIRQTIYFYHNNCIYDKWHKVDLVIPVFEKHDIIVQHYQLYLTINKYI